jgi:uncharacterized protein YdeI (YjbR/CyaY-like superfamily)
VDPATIEIASTAQWQAWLGDNRERVDQVWVAIYKKSTGKQTVTFDELLEEALCWGWVDTQTKGLDDERYSIRFRRRRPGSNWSPTNRAIVCRLLEQSRMTPAGSAVLPDDLTCPP